jgi:hypothetical protein
MNSINQNYFLSYVAGLTPNSDEDNQELLRMSILIMLKAILT